MECVPKPPNQALQQTAGHDSFLGLQAHRCPAAAELGRSSIRATMHEILICADHGEFLKLSVAGRSHPDCDDYWDGNWLRATVDVRAGAFRGSVDGDIRAEELVTFCGQLAKLHQSLQGVAEFDTLEDWLSIRATGDGLGHIEIRCVVLDQPGIGNRLEFTLASDQTFMKQTIDQLTETTKAFPVIGRA